MKIVLFFLITSSLFSQINFEKSYITEKEFSYTVVLPINYDPDKKYNLAIGLHGLFGDGKKMLVPFAYYSRYMNTILVCPDGNILDKERNSVKWGYDRSEKFLLSFLKHIKKKYNVEEDVFLFGFSQGANQGLHLALSRPDVFKFFVAISGGYTTLNEKQFSNSSKVKLLFLFGNSGEGEIYTKQEVEKRILDLEKYNTKAEKIIYDGLRHEMIFEEGYDTFNWFLKVSQKNNFLIEDYYPSYIKSEKLFLEGKFEESILSALDSISKNKEFAPNYLVLTKNYFYLEKNDLFKKNFFPAIEFYSKYDFFDTKEFSAFMKMLSETNIQFLNKEKFLEFLILELKERNKKINTFFKAELNLLIAEIYIRNNKMIEAKKYFEKSLFYFEKLEIKTSNLEIKLYISERINFLNLELK